MIDHDQISWEIYEEFFDAGEVLEIFLEPAYDRVDREMILEYEGALITAANLNEKLESIRELNDTIAEALGFSVPSASEVRDLCEKTEARFAAAKSSSADASLELSKLLGASLTATIR